MTINMIVGNNDNAVRHIGENVYNVYFDSTASQSRGDSRAAVRYVDRPVGTALNEFVARMYNQWSLNAGDGGRVSRSDGTGREAANMYAREMRAWEDANRGDVGPANYESEQDPLAEEKDVGFDTFSKVLEGVL